MRQKLQELDAGFAFQTSGRFDLPAAEHVPYSILGAADVDTMLRRSIERGEGVTAVIGRIGSGKSSLIGAVASSLDEGFIPLRVSVIGVEAGDPTAFARHTIEEIRDLPDVQLTSHETHALDGAAAAHAAPSTTRELRAGFAVGAGRMLTAKVVGDIKRAASEELGRATDPSHVLRGMQRLLDVFWKVHRCPVMLVEDTDHWGNSPAVADAFFDQTARTFANLDAAMVVATQSDYTSLDGYLRIRDRLTAEVALPHLPDAAHGLAVVLQHRMKSAGVSAALDEVLEPAGLRMLAQSYGDSVIDERAGDLRRTLSIMRASLETALSEPTANLITSGHMQEAIAKSPLAPSSALSP